jgi:hypothetical protein
MPQAGFEPAIPASERRQIHASDRVATEGYSKIKLIALHFGDWICSRLQVKVGCNIN